MRTTHSWPRAAVFDFDGTLVDSTHCWRDTYQSIARAHGRALDDLEIHDLAGASVAGAAARLSRTLRVSIEDRHLRYRLYESFATRPPLALPGARALVTALSHRVPLAIASNAPHDLVAPALQRLGIHDAFEVIISAEQTPAHKPAPDVYLEACRRLPVHPSDAVAFEDSILGVRAARAAGLVVIGVPSLPGLSMDADLTIHRLSDPRLLDYLGVTLPA